MFPQHFKNTHTWKACKEWGQGSVDHVHFSTLRIPHSAVEQCSTTPKPLDVVHGNLQVGSLEMVSYATLELTAMSKLPFLPCLHFFERTTPPQMPRAARTANTIINRGMMIPRAIAVASTPPGGGAGTVSHVLLLSSSLRQVPHRAELLGPRQPAPGAQEASHDESPVAMWGEVGSRR